MVINFIQIVLELIFLQYDHEFISSFICEVMSHYLFNLSNCILVCDLLFEVFEFMQQFFDPRLLFLNEYILFLNGFYVTFLLSIYHVFTFILHVSTFLPIKIPICCSYFSSPYSLICLMFSVAVSLIENLCDLTISFRSLFLMSVSIRCSFVNLSQVLFCGFFMEL